MNDRKLAVLFPGQGAFYGGALSESYKEYPQIDAVFSEIDAVAEEHLNVAISASIFCANPPDIGELLIKAPDVLQLAIYGVSVATYKVLESYGLQPAVLIGHSFGEIAAMVCAGAFSVREGAQIVCHRIAALKQLQNSGGYMAALGTDPNRAEMMLELVGNHQAVVAGENAPKQTVISGSRTYMDTVEAISRALQIPFLKLNAPYPFHSPLMEPAVVDFAARLRQFIQRPLQVPVFSPILGRYYQDSDVLTDCLAEHLIRPVRFFSAVQHIYGEGTRIFVESGALDTLGKLVKRVAGSSEVTIITCLDPTVGDSRSLSDAVQTLKRYDLLHGGNIAEIGDVLLPGVELDSWNAFWTAHGPRVLSYIRGEFEAFEKVQRASPARDPSIPDVQSARSNSPSVAVRLAPAATLSRAALFKELTAMYAAALEYPEEVFSEDVELEAELGIDSVKQTELLTRVSERYQLPPPPPNFRLSDYPTMGKLADFVFANLQSVVV